MFKIATTSLLTLVIPAALFLTLLPQRSMQAQGLAIGQRLIGSIGSTQWRSYEHTYEPPFKLLGTSKQGVSTAVYLADKSNSWVTFLCTNLDQGGSMCAEVGPISRAWVLK